MQRSLLHSASQLALGTCWFFPRTGVFQCLKGQSVLSNVGCKVILAVDPPKRCLHAGAAHFASKKTAFSSQPVDTSHKAPEERHPLPSAPDAPKQSPAELDPSEPDPLQDKSISLVQRFKKTFKQYGKVMIPVHLLTSTVWFGSFYYAAMNGVNVVPFLELIGLPDSVVDILKNSQSGNALTAYALYKIATPARYTVTLGGTSVSVKYLRKHGYMSTPPPVKEYLQDRMEETKDKITEKMGETKDKITEKMGETKDKITEKMGETKDKITEKMGETKDKITEKMGETKDKITEKMGETKDKITEKMEETKDKITEKMGETKDKITEKIQETKDKVSFKKIKE